MQLVCGHIILNNSVIDTDLPVNEWVGGGDGRMQENTGIINYVTY